MMRLVKILNFVIYNEGILIILKIKVFDEGGIDLREKRNYYYREF